MKGKIALCLLLTPELAYTAAAKGNTEKDRPNVIILLADDLGYGDLECYGAKTIATPAVNRLAKEGVRFTNVHATAATSTPSRYSLLTGEYAWRKQGTGVAAGNAGMIIRPNQYTLADLFKEAGYHTGAIGKWHLGLGEKTGEQDWNRPLPMHLKDLGFDYSFIMAATGDRVPCVYIENGQVSNYDPSAPIEVDYRKPFPGEPLGKDHPELLYNLKPSHGHDMAIVNGISRIGYMKGGGKALWKDENIADSITAKAIDFIDRHAHDAEPFFLYFATNDVHVPRFPHKRFRGKSSMGLRGDAILQFDWSVGEVLRKLEEEGIADNTLIILSSDNGPVVDDGYQDRAEELLGDHRPTGPLRGNKYSAFEGGTRVPALVRWPEKIKENKVSDALLSQIDWIASFAKMFDITLPENAAPDSRDQLRAWCGKTQKGCDYVIEQSTGLSIRTDRWKYIEPNNGTAMVTWGPKVETGNAQVPQLYDLKKGDEYTNLAEQHPEIVEELSSLLQKEKNKAVQER